MSNKICIYHKNCADGLTAALAVYNAPHWGKDTEFLSAQYGDKAPDVSGKDVIIVDFSYPRDILLDMNESANSLFVLDHHKTAQEALEDLPFARFDMNSSGAMMAWEYLHEPIAPSKIPQLVNYVQDRDLWRWKLPESKEVSAALASYPLKLKIWNEFLNNSEIERLKREGEAILRYQQTQIDRAIYLSASIACVPAIVIQMCQR